MARARYLIDTHVFLWAAADSARLGKTTREVLTDSGNELRMSAAAGWEIVIKYGLKKLPLPVEPAVYIPARARALGIIDLPIEQRHVLAIATLPTHHADPFDRIMIAQAHVEGLTFVTADPTLAKYSVRMLDATT